MWQSMTNLRRRAVGSEAPHDRRRLGSLLGSRGAVLRVPGRHPQGDYTTNAVESINVQLRKIIKARGHFPTDDAAAKLAWLGLRNIIANRARPRVTGRKR